MTHLRLFTRDARQSRANLFFFKVAGARAEQSTGRPFAANPRTRTACSESARRSDSPCAARAAPCAACAARALVVSAPPAGAGGARERHARSDRHEEKRKRRRPTQRANAPARLRRREPPVVYARAARVARASSVAPCAAPSLRSKRRPQKRRETRTTTGDREQGKITTVARTPLLDCGGESHPR